MTIDPFGGRIPTTSRQAPFDNALTVTPNDDTDLPVIPSAVYVPLWSQDSDGRPIQNAYPAGRNGTQSNYLMIEAQNGERLEMHLPPLVDMQVAAPILLPVRPRKILRTGTTLAQITLLW